MVLRSDAGCVRGPTVSKRRAKLLTISGRILDAAKRDAARRFAPGERLRRADLNYFIVAPTVETSAPKYAWLNRVQLVNKCVEIKSGADTDIKYDTFVMR